MEKNDALPPITSFLFSFHISVAAMEKLKFIQHSAELAKLTGNYYCTVFLIIYDTSDQIRKLDTSCSVRTKDVHAHRCHVVLTSYVISHIISHSLISTRSLISVGITLM